MHDAAEAGWVQSMLANIVDDGFRVAAPIAAQDGRWVVDGWSANVFIANLRPLAPDWDSIIAAGLRFGEAAERPQPSDRSMLDARIHRWAVADHVAGRTRCCVAARDRERSRGADVAHVLAPGRARESKFTAT